MTRSTAGSPIVTEPTLRLVPKVFRKNLYITFVLLAVVMFGAQFAVLLPFRERFVMPGEVVGFFEDFSTMANFALLNPLVLVILLRFFNQVEAFVSDTEQSGAIRVGGNVVRSRIRAISNSRLLVLVVVVAAAMTLTVMFLHIANTVRVGSHYSVAPSGLHVTGVVMMAITFGYMFVLLVGLLRVALWLRLLRAIFEDTVRVDFMHPDGAGGLRRAGALCLSLTYLLAALAITLGVFIYTDVIVYQSPASVRVLLMGPLYFVLTPIVFFYPLIPIHRVMERERERHLGIVSQRFNRLFSGLQSLDLDPSADRESLSNSILAMQHLQSMYAWINRLPRWPIDTPTYVRFALSLLLPFIGYVMQVLASDIGRLFFGTLGIGR